MPGNPDSHPFDKLGDVRKLLGGIVQPGDDQGGDVQPDPQLLEAHDGVSTGCSRALQTLR